MSYIKTGNQIFHVAMFLVANASILKNPNDNTGNFDPKSDKDIFLEYSTLSKASKFSTKNSKKWRS